MHPILLRSTGLVGLALAVVAIVSDQSFVSEPHAQTQPEIVVAGVRPQALDAVVEGADIEARAPAATSPILDTVTAAPANDPSAPSRDDANPVADVAAAGGARPAMAEVAAPTASAEAAATPAALGGVTTSEPKVVAAVMPAPDRFAVETPEPPKKASLWPEAATECPRDWVAADASIAGDNSAGCQNAAPLADQIISGSAADAVLQEVVSQRAMQLAGLQAPPRLPQARPERAPTKVKAKARSRRGGKLGPPPNCGKKYARWRYVNKVPTWYCK